MTGQWQPVKVCDLDLVFELDMEESQTNAYPYDCVHVVPLKFEKVGSLALWETKQG